MTRYIKRDHPRIVGCSRRAGVSPDVARDGWEWWDGESYGFVPHGDFQRWPSELRLPDGLDAVIPLAALPMESDVGRPMPLRIFRVFFRQESPAEREQREAEEAIAKANAPQVTEPNVIRCPCGRTFVPLQTSPMWCGCGRKWIRDDGVWACQEVGKPAPAIAAEPAVHHLSDGGAPGRAACGARLGMFAIETVFNQLSADERCRRCDRLLEGRTVEAIQASGLHPVAPSAVAAAPAARPVGPVVYCQSSWDPDDG